jgi:NADH-quinone oxidoreductase subunit G
VVAVGPRAGRLAEFATVAAAAPGGEAAVLADLGKGEGEAGRLLAGARKRDGAGPVVVLAGWRAAAGGALPAAARLAAALGGRLAWVPRRAGDRGALDAGARPDLLPGGRAVADADARRELGEAWGAELPAEPGLDAPAMLKAAAEGHLAVLILAGVDLVRDHGPRELAEQAMARSFVIAIDHELNETTRNAEVLLPGVVHAETEGTFTDWEGRVQAQHPAIPVGGTAQTVWELADQLSLRLKVDLGLGSIAAVAAETARWRVRPGAAAVPGELADPDPVEPAGPADGLALVTYPMLLDAASMLARAADLNRSTEGAFCELHPDDAGRLGLAAGQRAVLDFGDGVSAELPVRLSAGIAPGCAFVPANQPDLALGALLGPSVPRRVALRAAEEVAA